MRLVPNNWSRGVAAIDPSRGDEALLAWLSCAGTQHSQRARIEAQ
jgi:hypothetical protein